MKSCRGAALHVQRREGAAQILVDQILNPGLAAEPVEVALAQPILPAFRLAVRGQAPPSGPRETLVGS
jgi:hypothetical protein